MTKSGHIKSGQRERSEENNRKAIKKLMDAAEAAKSDTLLEIRRVTAWPSSDWFTVVPSHGRPTQVRGLDMGIAHLVSQKCKQCKQTQAGSDTWPMVMVSLPDPSTTSKTGEIIALLEPEDISQFAKMGFKVPGGSTEEDIFEHEEVNIDDI